MILSQTPFLPQGLPGASWLLHQKRATDHAYPEEEKVLMPSTLCLQAACVSRVPHS